MFFFSKTNARRHVYMYIYHTLYFSWIANQYDNIISAPQPKIFDSALLGVKDYLCIMHRLEPGFQLREVEVYKQKM